MRTGNGHETTPRIHHHLIVCVSWDPFSNIPRKKIKSEKKNLEDFAIEDCVCDVSEL